MSGLDAIATRLVARGKGILAADESLPSIEKHFKKIGVPSNEETRRAYRELLFTTEGIGQYLNGVILFDETVRQKTSDGTPFVELLKRQGIIPGVKVDMGTKPLAHAPEEVIAEGLDGLRERLKQYHEQGAQFTKWRGVVRIGANIPSLYCIEANAHALARYAALSQECDLVPIVEPEVLMDGDHTLERSLEVTQLTLQRVFAALFEQRVRFEGMVLKPNMVIAGKDHQPPSTSEEVAEATVRCLKRTVPPAVPGMAFLSGGQSEAQATANLNALNRVEGLPWSLTFSYGRALQSTALKLWSGRAENVPAAQKAFQHRARLNAAAQSGKYSESMERELQAV
jgi:fructose-bisphosphate aldolase, class I